MTVREFTGILVKSVVPNPDSATTWFVVHIIEAPKFYFVVVIVVVL